MTLVRVEEMREFNPHEDAASSTVQDVIPFETRYAPEGRSTVIYRAAEGELLEEVVLNPDNSLNRIESPETLPLSGSPVVEVPPDYLKFDLSLIRGIDRLISKQRMLESLVSMVLDLGVTPTAEGVETEAEEEVCRTIGFELAQGYRFGRPVRSEELRLTG